MTHSPVTMPRMAVVKMGVPSLADTSEKMGGMKDSRPSAVTARATASRPTMTPVQGVDFAPQQCATGSCLLVCHQGAVLLHEAGPVR